MKKKISLKNLNINEVEQLSREQLKNVLGGWSGSDVGSEILEVKCKSDCLGWDPERLITVRGTCSKSTLPNGLQMCYCSVTPISGSGTDCYAS